MQNNRFKVKQQILHNMLKIIQYPSDFEAFAPLIDITNNWNTELITTQLFKTMLRQVIRVLEHKWEWLTQDIYFQKIFQFYHDIFTKLKQNDICVNLMTLPCSLVVDPNTFTFKPIVAKTQMNMGVDEWIQWLKERNINLVYLYHCGNGSNWNGYLCGGGGGGAYLQIGGKGGSGVVIIRYITI